MKDTRFMVRLICICAGAVMMLNVIANAFTGGCT